MAVVDHLDLHDSRSLGILTDIASSNYAMTPELQITLEASGIQKPAMRNHIPSMAHVIQLALGTVMSSLGVKGHTKSWVAQEHEQQFCKNESIAIGQSQRLRKQGNARINKVSDMRPGLAKRIENVHISRHFETPDTNLHRAEHACCIDYADTGPSKWVHRLSKRQSTNRSTTYYGCEITVEFDTVVAWVILPITRIHARVAQERIIYSLLATLHDTGSIDHCQVCSGCFNAIPILDPVDVDKAYGYAASHHHCLQWHVESYGWRYVSFGQDENPMEERHILCPEVCVTEAV